MKTAIKETLLPCSLFEDMGFTYLDPPKGAKLLHGGIPASEKLMAVALMAYVEDNAVPLRTGKVAFAK